MATEVIHIATQGWLGPIRALATVLVTALVMAAASVGISSAEPYSPAQWQFINDFARYFPPTATPPEILSLATATCRIMRRGERAIDLFHDLRSVLGPIDARDAATIIAESGESQCPDMIGYTG